MGINELWEHLKGVAETHNFTDLAYRHFVENYKDERLLRVGVDANVVMASYRASDQRVNQVNISDTTFTQLFRLLCQFSRGPATCRFVYDGPERPSIKRGRKVYADRESDYIQKSKEFVEAFSYCTVKARGDADAELSYLNKYGYIDAVFTTDSDVFAFGAKQVLRVNSAKSTDTNLVVDVYHARQIRTHLGLTQEGLVLFALIMGNDVDDGVKGVGATTAIGLAKCGFGEDVVRRFRAVGKMAKNRHNAESFKDLKEIMSKEIEINSSGKLPNCSRAKADKFRQSEFPSWTALEFFLEPVTSWSLGSQLPPPYIFPDIPHLAQISQVCDTHIRWPPHVKMNHFHTQLWPAAVGRMLCSPLLQYNKMNSEIIVAAKRSDMRRVNRHGIAFALTLSTEIQGQPSFQGKKIHDTIRIIFTTADFLRQTGLEGFSGASETIRVTLAVPIAANATGQTSQIVGLEDRLRD